MDKYTLGNIIAQGTTCVVREAVDILGNKYAIKIVCRSARKYKDIKKEMMIHQHLQHSNIVKFKELLIATDYFIVMERVAYELFVYIEPKVGMPRMLVHLFFVQLISAIEYMHDKGICHRDIKPENILLSAAGNLFVTDFGSATLFRYKGRIRILNTICGSLPYIAPEVHKGAYNGAIADIWSCGIVLFVMATGILPWSRGDQTDIDLANYTKLKYHNYEPFSRLPRDVKHVFDGMCRVKVLERFTFGAIKQSSFFVQPNELLGTDGLCTDSAKLFSFFKTKNELVLPFSQPNQHLISLNTTNFVCSQPNGNDSVSLRRVYLSVEEEKIMNQLILVLDHFNVQFKRKMFALFFSTLDTYRNVLNGEFVVKRINNMCVISINRVKGSTLEFKEFCNVILGHLKSKLM
ncbi:Checkpoint kinase, serine/threonine protein kinase [Trachipleistophora hominis]|uniref:non-specific serine/threonine protein kinase n=1 Tax=Trachipleistophora hominis TaxID=72359 RepID=L7JT42_TRAHO|nr:Checkpoint kinase, serine/threonine protein kinase [Trachipleistophora hominis]